MRYNIIGKNIDVWDKTKEMVEKKMDRIAKLFPADTEATNYQRISEILFKHFWDS